MFAQKLTSRVVNTPALIRVGVSNSVRTSGRAGVRHSSKVSDSHLKPLDTEYKVKSSEDKAVIRGIIGGILGVSAFTGYNTYQVVTNDEYRWDGPQTIASGAFSGLAGLLLGATSPYGPGFIGILYIPYFIAKIKGNSSVC